MNYWFKDSSGIKNDCAKLKKPINNIYCMIGSIYLNFRKYQLLYDDMKYISGYLWTVEVGESR
jgi:hypothetical protein